MQRPGAAGADPAPQLPAGESAPTKAAEDQPSSWGDGSDGSDGNDDRLTRDKPPHWG
ncbi:hypothetical protein [Gryllotalpicola sp.]|uniref:hypothetical protein n=1 Tax=Gryllotalpicola sp. TaxID=1932787 RepID=UPI002606654E|nr:hypothetical protein [Gryllotalpicola sp.]